MVPSNFKRLVTLMAALGLVSVAHSQSSPAYELRMPVTALEVPTTPTAVPQGSLSSQALDFGNVRVGATSQRSFLLTSTGNVPLQLTGAPALTGAAEFTSSTNCGSTLEPGSSCAISIFFKPTELGSRQASLTLATDEKVQAVKSATVTGTGVQAELGLAAQSSADFGEVSMGSTETRTFTLTNTGTDVLSASSVSVTGSDLSLSANTCGTAAAPVTLQVGQACTVSVAYAPQSSGVLSGAKLVFASNDQLPVVEQALTGSAITGITASYGMTGGIRALKVLRSGAYTFEVSGAQGGNATSKTTTGGLGARVTCQVNLTAGTLLKVLVGEQGKSSVNYGGGGGGTYVTLGDNTPLCIGGGGSGASSTTNGNPGAAIGGNGLGGTGTTASRSTPGGGGLNGNGIDTTYLSGGKGFIYGGAAGTAIGTTSISGGYADGGFGGGGPGGLGWYNGGAGGGYQGGAPSSGSSGGTGGAGTSFNGGTLISSNPGVHAGNGRLTVTSPSAGSLSDAPSGSLTLTSGGTSSFFVTAAGTSTSKVLTLRNSASVPLTGIAPSLNTTGPFTLANGCSSTLAPGASCTLTVQYAPTVSNSSSATLTVTADEVTNLPAFTWTGDTTDRLVYNQVSESGTWYLSLTGGKVVREVLFASFGTPTGTGPAYAQSTCHASTSRSVVEAAFLNKSTGSLLASNTTFGGDPCGGTAKNLAIVLRAY